MKSFGIGLALAAVCAGAGLCAESGDGPAQYDAMIARHAQANGVPEALVRRVIVRESKYNPRARNGAYWGMMQLSMATARGAGFRGSPSELLDAETNLRYGVRYLAGAYKTARGNHDRAVGFFARGYYYAAKRQGMLASIGMGRDGKFSSPPPATAPVQVASAQPTPAAAPAKPELASIVAGSRPATGPVAAQAPVQTAAAPLPPVRGVPPAPTATASATAMAVPLPPTRGPVLAAAEKPAPVLASATPLPPSRGPVEQVADAGKPAAPRTINPSAAPVMASIAPVPRPRAEPATTGSLPARAASSASSPATATQPPAAQAAGGAPAIPVPVTRAAPAPTRSVPPALAYAEPANPTPGPIPLPPKR
ncbi:transglycosylase SLT domain-containing protein [Chelatococcus sambhunathii]|uniref:Transglycosylase SLT domain-containing protein n=1 Tax=Chelatococcus sambhunathii TaxID=363953 RepID=A0ABU1DCL9_9HYPH|nr:transglycosylase SLT domain-containing protein [Chelatococcus sambhunathii]MDR4305788.1 transglycosylase SLT domain-containing protein [Chelatococcus sambhunathii]